MAGNDDRNRILAAGRAYGATRLRRADGLRNLSVALGLAEGNVSQPAPDFFLKLGAARLE